MEIMRDHESSPQSICLHPDPEEGEEASTVMFSMVTDAAAKTDVGDSRESLRVRVRRDRPGGAPPIVWSPSAIGCGDAIQGALRPASDDRSTGRGAWRVREGKSLKGERHV